MSKNKNQVLSKMKLLRAKNHQIMKNIIKLFLALTVVFILPSCEGKYEDLDEFIIDKSNTTKYIIEGQITNLSSKHHILITKPSAISKSKSFEGVSNATVTLSDGINNWSFSELPSDDEKYESIQYSRLSNGVYESYDYFKGFEGQTYTLSVTIEGQTYTAEETMPTAEPALETELDLLKNTQSIHIFGQDNNSIWSSDMGDHESISIVLDGEVNFHDRIETEGVHGDGGGVSVPGSIFPEENEFGVLSKYSITNDYANFIWAFFAETDWQGSIFSAESSKITSNFNSPEIGGYFSVVAGSFYDAIGTTVTPKNLRVFNVSKSYQASYDQGTFKVSFDPTGQCMLEGATESMIGAYDILNDSWLRIHFNDSYKETNFNLYNFYQVSIKGALAVNPTPEEILYIGGNEGFQYINDISLKSGDGVIWE